MSSAVHPKRSDRIRSHVRAGALPVRGVGEATEVRHLEVKDSQFGNQPGGYADAGAAGQDAAHVATA
jgi:hypothetical protein